MQLWRSRTSDRGSAALRLVGVGPGRVSSRLRQSIQSNFEDNANDRSLCLDQPERTENLHHARRDEAALQGAFRRCMEGRAVQSGFHQGQSELENSRNRESRGAGRQALYRVRTRRDPDVSCREERKIPAEGHGQKYEMMQWLMFQLTNIGPMFGQFTHETPLRGHRKARLAQSPYLGGDEYSIADIATFPWTRNHDMQGVKWEDNPNLARWFKTIDERPAVKAALAKIAAIKPNRETATDDQKDRFFNRGRYARA